MQSSPSFFGLKCHLVINESTFYFVYFVDICVNDVTIYHNSVML